MISFIQKGDFKKLSGYLERLKEKAKIGMLDKFGREGVQALSAATPSDSGKTALSWGYEIERAPGIVRLLFTNSNINDGVPIAIVLQYGHGTGTGGYVQGKDYINPAIRPVFERLAREAWEEVKNA